MPPRGSTGEEDPGRRSVGTRTGDDETAFIDRATRARLILKPSLLRRQISVQSIGWIPFIDQTDNVPVIAAAPAA